MREYFEKEAIDVTRHWMIEMSGHVVRDRVMSLVCILVMRTQHISTLGGIRHPDCILSRLTRSPDAD